MRSWGEYNQIILAHYIYMFIAVYSMKVCKATLPPVQHNFKSVTSILLQNEKSAFMQLQAFMELAAGC